MLKKITCLVFASFLICGVVSSKEMLIGETKNTTLFLSSSLDSSLNRLSAYSYPVVVEEFSSIAIQRQNMDGSVIKVLAYNKGESRKLMADITIKFPKDQFDWGDLWLATDETCSSNVSEEILTELIPKLSFTNLYTLVLLQNIAETCFTNLSQFFLAGVTKLNYCVYVTNREKIKTLPDEVKPHQKIV